MHRVLSSQQAREIDRRASEVYGMPTLLLMENAGIGATDYLQSLARLDRVAIVCGKGNNGGDGFVIARHLANRGVRVDVWLSGPPDSYRGDAATNLRILVRTGFSIRLIEPTAADGLTQSLSVADYIIDALLGTGLTGTPRPEVAAVIRQINAAGRPVLAIDVPSGLDADSGKAAGDCVQATHTVTFVGWKTGFLRTSANQFLGTIHVADIGVPEKVIQEVLEQTMVV